MTTTDAMTDTYSEVQDRLEAAALGELEPAGEQLERFTIEGPRQAEWAMRKLQRAELELQAALEVVDAERTALATYEDELRARHASSTGWAIGLLEDYHRRNLEAELAERIESIRREQPKLTAAELTAAAWAKIKSKTLTTPAGKVAARRKGASAEAVDPDAFIAWARENAPELVAVKFSPDKRLINQAVKLEAVTDDDDLELPVLQLTELDTVITPTGEVVPGLHVAPASITYKVTPTI